jgi:hypothetical protein
MLARPDLNLMASDFIDPVTTFNVVPGDLEFALVNRSLGFQESGPLSGRSAFP